MEDRLRSRLDGLKSEFESGQKMLVDLEAKQAKLRDSLLRISGSIQVLEEALTRTSPSDQDNVEPIDVAKKEVS